MPRIFAICLLGFLLIAAVSGCTGTPAPNAPVVTPAATVPGKAKQPWEQEWDKVTAEARNEGTVVIAGNVGPSSMTIMSKVFSEKYGITPEFMSARGSEISLKISTEQNAGLYLIDVIFSTTSDVLTKLKPQGRLEKIDKALILPDVTDPKMWYAGEIPWLDKEKGYHLGFFAVPRSPVLINTQMTSQEQIKSYKDLLDPKWKGKIIINDPTLGGAGLGWFTALASDIGLDYFPKLIAQEPVLLRDQRLMAEWVARGKYPVLLGYDEQSVAEFVKAGAPIEPITLQEGAYTSQSNGSISVALKSPHPNATKVVLNWALSKEGGRTLAEAQLCQSARVDVPSDFLPRYAVRQPGIKYTNTATEDYQWKKDEYQKEAAKVFEPLIKK